MNTAESAYAVTHLGEIADGDLDKPAPFLAVLPATTDVGAVVCNAGTEHWVCA
jgi:hypothetical protein